jgi:hypothetical protein
MSKIIVGLTSTPPRVNTIAPTLLSLLNQELKPDEVVLTIPKVSARFNVPYQITNPDILKLVADGKIIINEIDHDYGPATKLVGLLYRSYDPYDILVWLDDDTEYGPLLLKCLSERVQPNNAVSLSGFSFDNKNNFVHPKDNTIKADDTFDMLEGFAGVATYKQNTPSVHDLELYNIRPQTYESLKLISKKERLQFMADDFTISQFFKKNNIRMNVVSNKVCNKQQISQLKTGFRADALHKQKHDTSADSNEYNYRYLLRLERNDDQNDDNDDSFKLHSRSPSTLIFTIFSSIFLLLLALSVVWLLVTHYKRKN